MDLRRPRVLMVSGGRREVDEARCLVDGGERLAMKRNDEQCFKPQDECRRKRRTETGVSKPYLQTRLLATCLATRRSAAAEITAIIRGLTTDT